MPDSNRHQRPVTDQAFVYFIAMLPIASIARHEIDRFRHESIAGVPALPDQDGVLNAMVVFFAWKTKSWGRGSTCRKPVAGELPDATDPNLFFDSDLRRGKLVWICLARFPRARSVNNILQTALTCRISVMTLRYFGRQKPHIPTR